MTATVIPLPSPAAEDEVLEEAEVSPTLGVVLYAHGTGGITIYEDAPGSDGMLGVLVAEELDPDQMACAGRALLRFAKQARRLARTAA